MEALIETTTTRVFFFADPSPAWYQSGQEALGCCFVNYRSVGPVGHTRTRSEALAIAKSYGVPLIERCIHCGGDAVLVDGVPEHLPPLEVSCKGVEVFLGCAVAA